MSRFLAGKYSALKPYTPGEQPKDKTLIKLNTNESPFPPSPKVAQAVALAAEKLNLYSDPEAGDLVSAIAGYYGVSTDCVLTGNGSDEILAFCFQAFCDEKTPACFPDISYGFYKVFADIYGLKAKIVPLRDDFSIEPSDYYGAGGTVFIANPNAPTGMALSLQQVESIAANNKDNVVVIDEAYVDFGADSAVCLTEKYNNLLVVQTFSKSRSLAGGRVGFAIACPELIADIKKIKYSFNPYNVGTMPQAAAAAAIRDTEYFNACTEEIKKVRGQTAAELTKLGMRVLPSLANFIFAAPQTMSGAEYFKALRDRHIVVRYFDAPRVKDFVRITIGTHEQMQELVRATKEILEERK